MSQNTETPKIKVELIENFLVVWNPQEGSKLYKTAYYGKPIGIPKPKIPEFDVPLILDLMEGFYLAETEQIEIYEGDQNTVSLETLREKARSFMTNLKTNTLFTVTYAEAA